MSEPMSKNMKDLRREIEDFDGFVSFISKFEKIIDTGKLAEFYCEKLFRLKPQPRNSGFDATSSDGKKIEIKHRFYSTKTPPGMEVDLEEIDYIYYVDLDESLLPSRIYQIKSGDVYYTKGKRVSFRRAFEERKFKLIFQK
ncbi:MAG: hypothetical protein H3Z53_02120 [archaeon]|nr:hypothetical protein [archaeon]